MGATVRIRRAGRSDAPALMDLHAQIGQDDGSVLPIGEVEALIERIGTYPDYQIRVAEIDGAVVGTYALLVMDNLAHRGAPSAIVEDVVVDGNRRGRGIGAAMMREAMSIARSRGCYKLVLNSNRLRHDAHRFYRNLGFERHGVSFHVTPGGTNDA